MSLVASASFTLYRAVTSLAGQVAPYLLRQRQMRGKEDGARLTERLGIAGRDRPQGPLIWIHGASVGESLAALPLIDGLLARVPQGQVMVTTGTVTSAALMGERLPRRAFHQFIPIDTPASVKRFLDYWRPDLALWLESEFWPNLIFAAAERKIPLVLVNGRLSERSHRGWTRGRPLAARLLRSFSLCLAQDGATARRLSDLGAKNVLTTGNLKTAAEPLPVDESELAHLRTMIGNRALWLASSTHAGEEVQVLDAHHTLSADSPGLLTIIVPRHPQRGHEVASEARTRGLLTALRSAGDRVDLQTQVYVADTLGELGLFYRLARIVFVGGSLIPHGGQNPYEPARLDCAILHGPNIANFAEPYAALAAHRADETVANSDQLAAAVRRLLHDAGELQRRTDAAKAALEGAKPLKDTLAALEPVLSRLASDARA
jgi:3-deoxy-D-manno-octulosonic-acid transferase